MDYFTREFETKNFFRTSRKQKYSDSCRVYDFIFNLNLSQLDPSIKNTYANVKLVPYASTLPSNNNTHLCKNTNIEIFLYESDIQNNTTNEITNFAYKELVKEYLYQYPFVLNSENMEFVKICQGHLVEDKLPNFYSHYKIKFVIECANNFPKKKEEDAYNLLSKILASSDFIQIKYSKYKVQGSFSDSYYKYKMGRCIVSIIDFDLKELAVNYIIKNQKGNFTIVNNLNRVSQEYSPQVVSLLKETITQIQKAVKKPIKIAVYPGVYMERPIFSTLQDTEYIKNEII